MVCQKGIKEQLFLMYKYRATCILIARHPLNIPTDILLSYVKKGIRAFTIAWPRPNTSHFWGRSELERLISSSSTIKTWSSSSVSAPCSSFSLDTISELSPSEFPDEAEELEEDAKALGTT